ncbi:MAG: hypothetical protein KUG78_05005 [Kangiellaceae bacterium]|nr:hypothetical protein [Kangiellaceae bacterium]
MDEIVTKDSKPLKLFSATLGLILSLLMIQAAQAGPREQAKRIHDRLAGVPPTASVLDAMETDITNEDNVAAAYRAMDNSAFYSVTLKNFVTPWTNEAETVFAPLNDYTATVIGIVRDDIDIREMLYGDILYTGNSAGLSAYSNSNNTHYEQMEDQALDLKAVLQQSTQSSITGLEAEATAGVLTSRAAAKAFLIDGTNRAQFRFTLINHLCGDLEPLKDTTRAADRIRQDIARSPGGDSRIFNNSCYGCHAGMDPMIQSFAYYNYQYDVESDPDGENGQLVYNSAGATDPVTGTRVQAKYFNNKANFPYGFITEDDSWDNYWRAGQNSNVGWDESLTGSGNGAKSMGQELSHSAKFAQCQVEKVFANVCLRKPGNAADRAQVQSMITSLSDNNFELKRTFAESAVYCMGE